MAANVYFVRSGSVWLLIDTGTTGCAPTIRQAAAQLFGPGVGPAAILLTHDHPDHAGSARALSQLWEVAVYVHSDEMPMVFGNVDTFRRFANPLDRWLVLPLMRLMGTRRAEAVTARASIKEVARALAPGDPMPAMADWEAIPTPGHTPGHVAFFRRSDRVLLAGDALLTVDINSPLGLATGRQTVAGPPWLATWDGVLANRSVLVLAALEPLVLAGGHGVPLVGPDTPERVRSFAARLRVRA